MTLKIDGNYGEGGGQILRTALSLSCVLKKPIEIYNIRKKRSNPGLQPQHLTCVNAAKAICEAEVLGNELLSQNLKFIPKSIKGGKYVFDVAEKKGSAGAVTLVLQTILLPLLFTQKKSEVTIKGGTHVLWSPPVHYLQQVFLPTLAQMSGNTEIELKRWGWYPKGNGEISVKIRPLKKLKSVNLMERGALEKVSGISAVSNLPLSIAERQKIQAIKRLKEKDVVAEIKMVDAPAIGKGTFVFLLAKFENTVAGFSSLGATGKRAEKVADEACDDLFKFLESEKALDEHLANQIIPYVALAEGKSTFSTCKISGHLKTNIWVVSHFLPIRFTIEGKEGHEGMITKMPFAPVPQLNLPFQHLQD